MMQITKSIILPAWCYFKALWLVLLAGLIKKKKKKINPIAVTQHIHVFALVYRSGQCSSMVVGHFYPLGKTLPATGVFLFL